MAYASRGFGLSSGLTPVVKRLIIANVAVFFVGVLISLLPTSAADGIVNDWFAFRPREVLTQPWTVVTYMFVHGDFWHILLNMLVLFFFGPPLEAMWGGREFTKFYFLCGLGGVALSFLLAPSAGLIGSSAAMYGLMLAFAMNWPTTPIYVWGIFPVQARWLVAFLFVVSVVSALGDPGIGGGVSHLAHLGGLVTGFIYLKLDWHASAKFDSLRKSTRVRRLAIVPRDEAEEEGARQSAVSASAARVDERHLLDAVDRVLDKISAEGMSSLTADERRLLDEVSRRHRTN
jgi:membrane associated rhomboid family serine protease